MRAYPVLSLGSSYLLFFQATATSHSPSRFLFTASNQKTSQFLSVVSPKLLLSQLKLKPSNCSNSDSDSSVIDASDNDYDDYVLLEERSESLSEDGVYIEINKLGKNSRRIRSKIEVDASLDTVWNILTDYDNLADFFPNLAVNELVEKKDNFARLYQIGQQNLALGLKFNAKGVLDCYEKDLEILPSGKRRDIEFKMIEGDFQLFEGKWSVEQFNRGKCDDNSSSPSQEFLTTVSYSVDVQPRFWLPVRLIEGRLCKEIKGNLSCIREATKKVINKALHKSSCLT